MEKITLSLCVLFGILACNQTSNDSNETFGVPNTLVDSSNVMSVFLNDLKPKKQIFNIKPGTDTLIITKGNTMIFIPSTAFSTQTKGDITFDVHEYTSNLDFISENLTTSYYGEIIETAGMFYISASQNGNKIYLNENEAIKILIPKEINPKIAGQFVSFSGWKDDSNNINWSMNYEPKNTLESVPIVERDNKYGMYSISKSQVSLLVISAGIDDRRLNYIVKSTGQDINSYSKEYLSKYPDQLKRFNQIEACAILHFNVNENGKIYDIIPEKKSSLWIRKDDEDCSCKTFDSTFVKLLTEALLEMPPLDLDSVVISDKIKVGDEIYDGETDFISSFEKKYNSKSKEKMSNINKDEVNQYVIYSMKLGWINCDRFIDIPKNEKTDLIVHAKEDSKTYILFDEFKSILNGKYSNNSFHFKSIPLNKEITVVSIFDNHKEVVIKCGKSLTSNEKVDVSTFETVSLEKLKRLLN